MLLLIILININIFEHMKFILLDILEQLYIINFIGISSLVTSPRNNFECKSYYKTLVQAILK